MDLQDRPEDEALGRVDHERAQDDPDHSRDRIAITRFQIGARERTNLSPRQAGLVRNGRRHVTSVAHRAPRLNQDLDPGERPLLASLGVLTSAFHYDKVEISLVAIDPGHELAMRRLVEDFENFPGGHGSTENPIEIEVSLASGESTRFMGAGRTRFTPRYRFFGRRCEHGGGTTSRLSRRGRRVSIEVRGTDTEHVYEVAYVALLAVLGWELEKIGFLRLHAFGVRIDGEAMLFHLPPKGGKSTLALECSKAGLEILGDEIVLVKGQRAHAFPIRAAVARSVAENFGTDGRTFKRKVFDDKELVAIPRVSLEGVDIVGLVFQSRAGLASSVGSATFFEKVVWGIWLCLGFGLPQMREFIVRTEELVWFPVVFARRLSFLLRYLSSRRLLISRGIEDVDSTSIRPRLGWVRSSLSAIAPASDKFRSELLADKEDVKRA